MNWPSRDSPKSNPRNTKKREEGREVSSACAETLFISVHSVVRSPHFPYLALLDLTLHGSRRVLMAGHLWQRARCTTPDEESDTHPRSHPNALSRVEQLGGTS